ncbi:ABC transporter permease [Actinoplanes sp. NEAU-A12]|uniref:ABC transporter permease n=1 Tax=Actinoplanes sandaracinus TaxID=3045177 RepID=A0ABT6WKM1_9ACTN|nr:ABC transporter permease [Actinoplanes sandaracinus]MDI6100283.1 ABC transporter permease [Actinoplanes sandaracinus]
MRRSGLTVALGVVLPVALGLLILWAEADTGRAGPGVAVGLLLSTLMALTAYVSATTTLAARRQQSVLRRLRNSGASDTAILTGTLVPSAMLSVAQTVVLLGVVAAADGLGGVAAVPLVLAVMTGTAVACAFAALTAAFTSAPELAQLTTTPIALAFLGGALWTAQTPPGEVTWMMLSLPGAAVTQLARIAWQEPGAGGLLPAVVPLALAAVAAVGTASRVFTWDLRR